MKPHLVAWIFLAVGIVLGSATTATYFYLSDKNKTTDSLNASTRSISAEADKQKAEVNSTLPQKATESAEVKATSNTESSSTSTSSSSKETSVAEDRPSMMKKIGQDHIKKMQRDKLLKLKTRLNLTTEQEAALHAQLDQENARTSKIMDLQYSGQEMTQEIMSEFKDVKTTDQVLEEILTPEQKEANNTLKTDESKSNSEMMTNYEISKFSTLLNLTEEQKDQLYSAFYQINEQSQNPKWIQEKMAIQSSSTDPMAGFDFRAKLEIDAAEKILTPEQFSIYKTRKIEELDDQKKMMEKFMPKPKPATLQ